MPFHCSPALKDPVATLAYKPWAIAIDPFQVSPRTWYVSGQTWVGCYLIDTGDGLILLDTAIPESSYLLVNSIYKAGFDPKYIKKILVSHAHFDHCGAAAEMHYLTGAPIYMSKEDWDFMKACPDETLVLDPDSHPQEFTPDYFYSDDEPIVQGDIEIHTILTPGHTIGCTSFFWKETNPVNGQIYDIAIHVDIALPSHPNQIEITDRAGTYTDESQPYLDDTVWADFMEERARQVRALMK